MPVVGVDIGTQSLKAVIVADDLAVLGEAAQGYDVAHPRPGWAEQDPHVWERALAPAIARALAQSQVAATDIRALGIAGQLDGCVAIDGTGEPLGPCLIWMDRRAIDELPDFSAKEFRQKTGLVADPGHMAAKIRWLSKNGAAGAVRFHQPVSYLVSRLCGAHVIDHGLASTTMLCGPAGDVWDDALCAAFAIDPQTLPAIASADAIAGPITQAGAALCGLPAGIPVAVGTGDDFATPLGAGVLAAGPVAVTLGTAEVVGAVSAAPVIDGGGLVETHAYPGGQFFVENPGWLAGGAMKWLVELFSVNGFAALDALAAEIEAGADGLLFLPQLGGAMSPAWNASARGAIYGLAPSHTAGHIARAAMEGCAFAARAVIARLTDLLITTDHLVLLGGGATSRLWSQMHADVCNLPAHMSARTDTCAVGAAMLAAVAGDIADDLDGCAARVTARAEIFYPDPKMRSICEARYMAFRELFDCMRPMYR